MTTMMHQQPLSIRDYVFGLHKILVKGYENPEITQRMTDFFYDSLSKVYPDIEVFAFNDFDCSYQIKTRSFYPELEQTVKEIYTRFILSLVQNTYTFAILCQYDYNYILNDIISSRNFTDLVKECITILNLSTDQQNMVFKINLHN